MEGVLTDSPHLLPYLIRHSLIEVLELYTETKVSQLRVRSNGVLSYL